MLKRAGGDVGLAAAVAAPPAATDDGFAAALQQDMVVEEAAPAAATSTEHGVKRQEIIEKASKVEHYDEIAISLYRIEYTEADGIVAKGAKRVEQQNDAGETRVVLSPKLEEKRKQSNALKKDRRGSKKPRAPAAEASDPTDADGVNSVVAALEGEKDPLSQEQEKAAAYNAKFLGADDGDGDADDAVSVSGTSMSAASNAASGRELSTEDQARRARQQQAKKEANAACNAAAEAEVKEFEGTPEYDAKLAAAKRRLKPDFTPAQMVADFGDDAHQIKLAHPMLLMKWTNTLTCQQESPFSVSDLLDPKAQEVAVALLQKGYNTAAHPGPTHDLEECYGKVSPPPESRIYQLRAHTLDDGYEALYEFYPLEKATMLLAAAKGCADDSVNVKVLFRSVIDMPVKMKTDYARNTLVHALEKLLEKGDVDWENNALKVPVTYRPGNNIAGVSRSYATYPSHQTIPSAVRIALMGPHLHDMDLCCALPTSAVIGIVRLDKDPSVMWSIGYAYLMDRWEDLTSGRNEKRFQMQIVKFYAYKITVDDAKELLHIAMNNGRFEWYLERDFGIRTTEHAPELVQMREQTNGPNGLRDLFLANGDAVFGPGNYTKLRDDVYTRKHYATTETIYTDGALPDDPEKAKRTLFALGLHTIERSVMRVCMKVATEMKLVPFSSIHDGMQIIHPRVDDWVGKLEAYRQECHERCMSEFKTHVYLVEKPFYITGVAHPDGDRLDNEGGEDLDPKEAAFGKLLQNAYAVS